MTDVDPTRCPLCGQPNRCTMACGPRSSSTSAGATPCWCTAAVIPQSVIDAVPTSLRGKACLCIACACPDGAAARR